MWYNKTMAAKNFFSQLNIFQQCKRYNLPLWQCPAFLFFVMGVVIIVSSLVVYYLGNHYITDPQIVALMVLVLTAILFIIAFIIIQSFERLAEASRLKSEFVSIVSHQLRSPLSNLRWALDLLMSGRMGTIEEEQLEYFKILKENSTRMRELVSDLLIVSRIEMAGMPLKKKNFSLVELTNELIENYKLFAKASNIDVKFEPEPNLPEVFADPNQIKIVVENLLDNAIRYIKDRGEVDISVKRSGANVYFEITDSGVGIPKKDQKYIFQKFFRSENALRYQTQGSGLGLYISRSVIEKSGGKIGFKSQEGKGSTFWLTLPIK